MSVLGMTTKKFRVSVSLAAVSLVLFVGFIGLQLARYSKAERGDHQAASKPEPPAPPPSPPPDVKGVSKARPPIRPEISKSEPPALPGVKGYREVFYATDRRRGNDGYFTGDAASTEDLEFGHTVVSIPENHTRGELERPWSLFSVSMPENSRTHIRIAQRATLNREAFFQSVTEAIDTAPGKAAFVFVHGFQ